MRAGLDSKDIAHIADLSQIDTIMHSKQDMNTKMPS